MKKIIILGILTVLAVLAVPMASAADVTLYFKPQHNCVPQGYCNNTTVELWIDIPAGAEVDYGQFGFDYDPACGDIVDRQYNTDIMTGVDPSWSFWNSIYSTDCWDYDTDWIVFDFWIPKTGPVQALIGNFTIHCNSTDYCVSELNFSCKQGCLAGCIILWDRYGDEQSINLSNGTIECGINVDKTVYNPDTGKWEDSISGVEKDTELRFRINVSAGPCYNYTNLVVDDTLPVFLTYNDSATPSEPTDLGSNKYQWILGLLNNSETKTIEFNATASDSGSGANEVDITMDCVECGGAECSGADAVPVHVKPAGICGDVTGDGFVRVSDGIRIISNQTFVGDPRFFVDPWAADVNCDGHVRVSDGIRIISNQTFVGDPRYFMNCC